MRIAPPIPSIIAGSRSAVVAGSAPAAVIDIETTVGDLEAMGTAYRSQPGRSHWIGPVQGRYDLETSFPGTDFPARRQTGSARVYHARVGTEEWALTPFFNPHGTGFMHQPAVLRRTAGTWQVVTNDPAPGELHEHLPKELLRHWGIVDGMPPKDSVTNDEQFPGDS